MTIKTNNALRLIALRFLQEGVTEKGFTARNPGAGGETTVKLNSNYKIAVKHFRNSFLGTY